MSSTSKALKKSPKKKKAKLSSYQLKKLKSEEVEKKLRSDSDFIASDEHDNSLEKFLKENRKAKEYEIADFLQLTTLEVNKIFKESLKKIKYFLQE